MAKKNEEAPGLVRQLRNAITSCGMSLTQLGKATGVGPNQLSRFLRGQRTLTLPIAEKLCRFLHLELVQSSPVHPLAESGEVPSGEDNPKPASKPKGT